MKPEARLDILEKLRSVNVKPTSMIDISDGLASEILHICDSSSMGCRLFEEKIPVDITTASMSEEFNLTSTISALNGGEDYELLFTIELKDFEKVKNIKEISPIGHITEAQDGIMLLTTGGASVPINAQGWDAFLRKNQ